MKKLIFIIALAITFLGVEAQTIYSPANQTVYGKNENRVRATIAMLVPTGCGVPAALSSVSVISNQSAIYFDSCNRIFMSWDPATAAWLRVTTTSIPWDSITGKPSNFSTTYALSNDIQDSIQNRVPYENATRNLIIGNYRVSARTLLGDSIFPRTSAGGKILSNSGSVVAEYGVGGGDNFDFHGFAGYNANRSASYTARSFTDKNYVDSGLTARLASYKTIADTFFTNGYTTRARTKQQIDSLSNAVANGFVTIGTTQDISGQKSFTHGRIYFATGSGGQSVGGNSNGIHFGNTNTIGGTSNIVFGFESRGTGDQGIAIGFNANSGSSGASNNISIGQKATEYISSGFENIALGRFAANGLSTGSGNIALGSSAGHYIVGGITTLQTNTNSIFIGNATRGTANGNINEIVIGQSALGNGSNTVTIGNSSITNNYFNGSLRTTQDLYFTGGNNNKIEFVSEDGVIYTNGGSYITLGASGNAGNMIFDRTAASWGIGTANPTQRLEVNGNIRASSFIKVGGTSSEFLKADGSVDGTSYAPASALSGYMDLTTAQTAAGNKTFSSGFLQVGNSTAASQARVYGGTAGSTYPELSLYGASSDHNWTLRGNHATNFTIGKGTFGNYGSTIFTLSTTGAVTLVDALSGTSAAFSDNITLAAGKYLGFSSTAYITPEDNIQGARIKTLGGFVVESGSNTFNSVINGTSAIFTGNGRFISQGGISTAVLNLMQSNNANGYYFSIDNAVDGRMELRNDAGTTIQTWQRATQAVSFSGALSGTSAAFSGAGSFGTTLSVGSTATSGQLSIDGASNDAWSSSGSTSLVFNGNAAISTITTFLDNSSIRIGAGVTQKTGIFINGHTATDGSYIALRTGNAERVRLSPIGYFGVGTTSPYTKLNLRDGLFSITTSDFAVGTTGSVLNFGLLGSTGNVGSFIQARTVGDATSNGVLSLNPDGGNVGIGTSTPGFALQVNRTSATASYLVGSNDGGVQTAIGVAGDNGSLLGTLTNHLLRFVTNGAVAGGISTSQNWLVKTTTDNGTDALQVAGSVSATSNIKTATGFNSTASGVTASLFSNFAGGLAGVGTETNNGFGIFTNNTARLTIDNTGAATFSSSVYALGHRFAYASKSSNYTLTDNDDYITVTASSTITLPTAVGRSGKRYIIKCVGSVTATIATTSSQTIDGNSAGTYTFGGPNFNIMIVYSDGSNWLLEAWASGI